MKMKRKMARWTAVVLALSLITTGAVLVWRECLRPRLIAKNFGVVEDGAVYRSGQISRFLVRRVLQEKGIDVVIALSGYQSDCPDQQAEREAARDLGIDIFYFPMRGNGTGSLETVADAVASLAKARAGGKQVLVHCSAGAQRTAHVLSAYSLLVQKSDSEKIFAEMQEYGWKPEKNREWPEQLNENMTSLARLLVESGVIHSLPAPLPHFGPKEESGQASAGRAINRRWPVLM